MEINSKKRGRGAGGSKIPAWVILICLATLVFGIAGHALWTADEPREAEIAREMAAGGSWVIPHLAGVPFVEKPPLYYWLSALAMMTAGKIVGTTVAARAIAALCGALTLWILWLVLREYLGRYRARAAVLILTTMAGFFQATHWILIDPLLMLLVTAAVLFFFQGFDRDRPSLLLGAYLAAGLAFLTKGFVAWGLLAVPWGCLMVLYFREIAKRPLLHLAGILLLIGPGLAWAVAFYSRGGPELWNEWFINNQIGRFSGQTTHSHERGMLYYLGVAPILLLPWTPLLLGGIRRRSRDRIEEAESGGQALLKVALAWALGGLILLSLASTKRGIYLYPLLPGFACLAAFSLNKNPYWVEVVYRFLCPILVLPSLLLSLVISGRLLSLIPPTLTWKGTGIGLDFNPIVIILAVAGIFALVRFKNNLLPRVATVSGLLYLTVIFAVFPLIDAEKNYEPATRRLTAAIPTEGRGRVCGWYTDETIRAIFSYYTGLTLIDLRDKVNPEKNLGRLANILSGNDEVYDSVIVLLKRDREFPPKGMPEASFQIVKEEKMGRNRRLLLLTGQRK
ncbi:MAG: glycosyltransferase family 39 protein [Candidatus Euphemobacter frigidus]|nr:glycosyltransferase family 39 protein [Candidatus Euphemobacter frigidus]MDP8275484.1 glycosyltransferase family 39 protein [Candidatus Euphemobacter frigidus]